MWAGTLNEPVQRWAACLSYAGKLVGGEMGTTAFVQNKEVAQNLTCSSQKKPPGVLEGFHCKTRETRCFHRFPRYGGPCLFHYISSILVFLNTEKSGVTWITLPDITFSQDLCIIHSIRRYIDQWTMQKVGADFVNPSPSFLQTVCSKRSFWTSNARCERTRVQVEHFAWPSLSACACTTMSGASVFNFRILLNDSWSEVCINCKYIYLSTVVLQTQTAV